MRFSFRPMTEPDARSVLSWRYEGPYAFYNVDSDDPGDVIREMLDGTHWAVEDERGYLVGFLAIGPSAQVEGGHRAGAYERHEGLDIGLGMRPDLTGKGAGLGFVTACVEFARRELGATTLRLAVAIFNERAIRVYERVGFRRGPVFPSRSPAGEVDFLLMTST